MNRESIIEKIRKLRSLAGNNSSLEEATTATRLAEELLQKNQIAEAELEITMGSQEQVLEDQEALTDWKTKQTVWQNILLTHLCSAYNCKGIIKHKNGCLGYFAIGRPSDLLVLKYQYAYMVLELTRLASLLAPKTLARGSGKTWHKSFYLGAVRAIGDSLVKVKQEIKSTANSSALAVIDQHAQEALNLKNQLYPKSKTVMMKSHYDREAWELGNRAGRNLETKTGLGSGVPRGLLAS